MKYKKTNQIQSHVMIQDMYVNLAELLFHWSDVDTFSLTLLIQKTALLFVLPYI